MNKKMRIACVTLVAIFGMVGIVSMIAIAEFPHSPDRDLPYVQVCCMQSEFYIPGTLMNTYALPITVNVYDERMNPARGYTVNATISYGDGYSHADLFSLERVTRRNGIVRFGFQLPEDKVESTFISNCPEGRDYCLDAAGNSSPYFVLRITVSGEGHTHNYFRPFAFVYD